MSKLLSDKDVAAVFRRLKSKNPEPKGELEYTNAFTLLVAVVLSAQATDVGVNRATRALFQRASSPAEMIKLGEAGLTEYIKTIGLFRSKAKNVIALSQILLDEHGGEVPDDRDALEGLPGVGRKTANVVLNTWFGHATIAVDTHIFRIANRIGLVQGRNPREIEDGLLARVPKRYLRHAHHWLILHGRYVCKARKPDCENCAVFDLCTWEEKSKGSGNQ